MKCLQCINYFFTIAQENARRAEVTCPNGSTNGTILWRSPQLPYSFINVFLSDYMLRCVCLLGSNFSIVSKLYFLHIRNN